MELVFLGTGASFPTKERNVSSLAVRMGRVVVLFDCGEGTQRQIAFTNISFMKIRYIFISHLHGDHFLGLPGLVQTMGLNERTEALDIYTVKGTGRSLSLILGLGGPTRRFEVTVHELEGGECVETPTFTVRTMDGNHNIPSLIYSLQEPSQRGRFNKRAALRLGLSEGRDFKRLIEGRSVEVDGKPVTPDQVIGPTRPGLKLVYTGDTGHTEGLVEFARGADVLVHESTFDDDLCEKAGEFFHSTSRDAARTAAEAGVERLFLTHLSPRYKDAERLDVLRRQAEEEFPEVRIADDLDTCVIKRK